MLRNISFASRSASGRYWWRLAIFTAITLTVAALFLLVYFINLQVNAFITPNRVPVIGSPADVGLAYRDVTLTTADGLKLASWYIPGRQPNAIILVHGIDANRAALLPHAAILTGAEYHLLLFDLRGHGQSEGSEITYGYREALDVQAAVDYLLALPEIKQVGALGTSLGGAVVVRAAAVDSRLRAIVIESSFSSLTEAVEEAFEDRSIFPKWPFAPLLVALAEQRVGLKVSQVDSARDLATLSPRPVLIIHGAADSLFPPDHALKMYGAAKDPKTLWLIEGLGHENPISDHEAEYRERVLTFFEKAFASDNQTPSFD
jgi:fermentation-respiration switch protein FrsA (DUF1100 family)